MAGLTASEMMYEAKVLYESMASADAPGFTPREWSVLLSQAQEKVVLDICADGVDKNEFNVRALAQLREYGVISGGSITSAVSTTGYQNSYFVSKTSLSRLQGWFHYDPLFYFEQRGTTNTLTNIKIKTIPQDYTSSNLSNPYKKPSKITFWQLPYKDMKEIVITDGSTLTNYYCGYIKKPYPIIVPYAGYTSAMTIEGYNLYNDVNPNGDPVLTHGIDCKLDAGIHRKIVNETAALAKATNKEQLAFQLQQMQENT